MLNFGNFIPTILNQNYAPWVDPKNVKELPTFTIWDQLGHAILGFLSNAWQCTVQSAFWVSCLACVILLIYYAFMKDKRCVQWVGFTSLTYMLIEVFNFTLKA
ncbi:MAG TPA: hypothetical protein VIK86_08150 [Candidatus Paceibacterota bacterium]